MRHFQTAVLWGLEEQTCFLKGTGFCDKGNDMGQCTGKFGMALISTECHLTSPKTLNPKISFGYQDWGLNTNPVTFYTNRLLLDCTSLI